MLLKLAANSYRTLGYDGTLTIALHLERFLNIPVVCLPHRIFHTRNPSSRLDNEVLFDVATDTRELADPADPVFAQLMSRFGFAINYPVLGTDEELQRTRSAAYAFNELPAPADTS